MSSGRWHCAQFLNRIGATSLLKVICLFAELPPSALMVAGAYPQIAARVNKETARIDLFMSLSRNSFYHWHHKARDGGRYCALISDDPYLSPVPLLFIVVEFFTPLPSTV